MLSRPIHSVLGSFAGIAAPAEKLKICAVVRPSKQDRRDMVDFKRLLLATPSAAIFLQAAKIGHVLGCEGAPIPSNASASLIAINNAFGSNVLNVGKFPCFERVLYATGIVLSPALDGGSMASRISSAPQSNGSGFISWPSIKPALTSIKRALDADAVRDEASVVTMLAWCSGRVMDIVALARRYSIGMFRRFGLMLQSVSHGAGRTQAVGCISLGDVSVSARLAGQVKPLSSRSRGFSFGYRSHRPSISRCVGYLDSNASLKGKPV